MDWELENVGEGGHSGPLKEETFELRPPWSLGRSQKRFGRKCPKQKGQQATMALGQK